MRPKAGVRDDDGGRIGWDRSQRGHSVFYPEDNGESTKESGQERSKFRFGLQKSHSADRVRSGGRRTKEEIMTLNGGGAVPGERSREWRKEWIRCLRLESGIKLGLDEGR